MTFIWEHYIDFIQTEHGVSLLFFLVLHENWKCILCDATFFNDNYPLESDNERRENDLFTKWLNMGIDFTKFTMKWYKIIQQNQIKCRKSIWGIIILSMSCSYLLVAYYQRITRQISNQTQKKFYKTVAGGKLLHS